jgi:hypothetical protein
LAVRAATADTKVFQGQREWRRLRRRERRWRARRQGPRPGKELVILAAKQKKSDISMESVNFNVFNGVVKFFKPWKITTKFGLTDLPIYFLYREGNDGREN